MSDTLQLPSPVKQEVFKDGKRAAEALAARVATQLRTALAQRGRASLVVSGGRTPASFQQALSHAELDWSQVTVTLADDRWVAEDHADSNARLVRENLLRGPAAAARFLPLVNGAAAPEQHLSVAEAAIATLPRPYDAVLLGMGDDGHTASLFPGAEGTEAAMDVQREARLALVTPRTAAHRRITLTLRSLMDARSLMILIEGEGKRAAIERAAAGTPTDYPIAAVLQQRLVPVEVYYSP